MNFTAYAGTLILARLNSKPLYAATTVEATTLGAPDKSIKLAGKRRLGSFP